MELVIAIIGTACLGVSINVLLIYSLIGKMNKNIKGNIDIAKLNTETIGSLDSANKSHSASIIALVKRIERLEG